MTISDGMRIHNEGGIPRYRVPDLLSPEEFKMYMASTYGVGVEFVELSDDMRDRIVGVGTLPAPTVISDRDRETMLLRKQLGLEDNGDEVTKELHSRVMTREEFSDKYGPQPEIAPPKEDSEEEQTEVEEQTEEQRQASQEQAPRQNPSGELSRLLEQQKDR